MTPDILYDTVGTGTADSLVLACVPANISQYVVGSILVTE